MHRRTYQRLCDEIEAATDLAFFGGSVEVFDDQQQRLYLAFPEQESLDRVEAVRVEF